MNSNEWASILSAEYRVWKKEEPADVLEVIRRTDGTRNGEEAWELVRRQVEKLSDGKNTVMLDANGFPSVMVRLKAVRACDLLKDEDDESIHPAFRMGSRMIPEIWIGKYLTSLWKGAPVSLPMAKPQRYARYEEAAKAAREKGPGWQMTSYQVSMALALTSLRGGTLPGGNNEKGHDHFQRTEEGELLDEDYLVRTGSGPARWSHDGTPAGVWDLNGNLNEWQAGLRLMDGEIQIQEMETLCGEERPWEKESKGWQPMDPAGRPTAPGSGRTLHYENTENGIRLIIGPGSPDLGNCAFQMLEAQEGLTPGNELKMRGLYPSDRKETRPLGWRWISGRGEALPLTGGAYLAMDHAGIFFTGITKPRDEDYSLGGMRLMYIAPDCTKAFNPQER